MNAPGGREPEDATSNEAPGQRKRGAWRHLLIWSAFGLTFLLTVAMMVQIILQTRGFA